MNCKLLKSSSDLNLHRAYDKCWHFLAAWKEGSITPPIPQETKLNAVRRTMYIICAVENIIALHTWWHQWSFGRIWTHVFDFWLDKTLETWDTHKISTHSQIKQSQQKENKIMSLNGYVAPPAEINCNSCWSSSILGGGDIKGGIITGFTTSGQPTQLNASSQNAGSIKLLHVVSTLKIAMLNLQLMSMKKSNWHVSL